MANRTNVRRARVKQRRVGNEALQSCVRQAHTMSQRLDRRGSAYDLIPTAVGEHEAAMIVSVIHAVVRNEMLRPLTTEHSGKRKR